jgi:hypothetical protein
MLDAAHTITKFRPRFLYPLQQTMSTRRSAASRPCYPVSRGGQNGTSTETLEDVFVRVVGADHPAETLDWL